MGVTWLGVVPLGREVRAFVDALGRLNQHIATAAQAAGDADLGDTYYHHWLAALEALVAAKGAAQDGELARCARAWDHAADRTPHGQPIVLQPADWNDA